MQRNKKRKKNLILKTLLILSIYTMSTNSLYAAHPEEPIYCKYADKITEKYCADMAKTYKLYYYGGGGGFMNNVNKIDLSFNTIQNLNIAEARILIIKCTEERLKRINADKDIKPYLSHYPFTEKGIALSISFDDKDQNSVSAKFVAMVFTVNGDIYYSSYNHNKKKFQDLHEESYQEALKIVNNTSKSANDWADIKPRRALDGKKLSS